MDDDRDREGINLDEKDLQKAGHDRSLKDDPVLLRTVIDNLPDYIYAKDAQGRYVLASAAYLKMLGIDAHDKVVGKTVYDVFPEKAAAAFHANDLVVLQSARPLIAQEEQYITPTGEIRWQVTTKVPLFNEQAQVVGLVGISRDISIQRRAQEDLRIANEQLIRLAREDGLTGLFNRRTIIERGEQEWDRRLRYGQDFSILIIDVDDFKAINDNHGHLVGDRALRLLAEQFSVSLRSVDYVGRYGGEEFLVVLPATDIEGAVSVAQKILASIRSAKLLVHGHLVKFSVSIGAAVVTKDDRQLDDVIHRADNALYSAKQTGKDRIEVFANS